MNLFGKGNEKKNHLTDGNVQGIVKFNNRPHEHIISTV